MTVRTPASPDPAGGPPVRARLDLGAPAADGFRFVLSRLADVIALNWEGGADGIEPERLHELRIAIRQTRTVLTQAKHVLPVELVAPARERFRALAALTSPARDLDVFLAGWPDAVDALGKQAGRDLEPVRLLLAGRRAAAHAALADGMRSPETEAWRRAWRDGLDERFVARAGDDPDLPEADSPLSEVIADRITHAHRVMVHHGRRIDRRSPDADLHALRKDAKRLRYVVECFADVLPDAPRRRFVRRLRKLQDNLGAHQDAVVHGHVLEQIAAELLRSGTTSATVVALWRFVDRAEQTRATERRAFHERFASFDSGSTRQALRDLLEL